MASALMAGILRSGNMAFARHQERKYSKQFPHIKFGMTLQSKPGNLSVVVGKWLTKDMWDGVDEALKDTARAISRQAKGSIRSKSEGGGSIYTWVVDTTLPLDDESFEGWRRMPNGRWLPVFKRMQPYQASAEGEAPNSDKERNARMGRSPNALSNDIGWRQTAGQRKRHEAEVGNKSLPYAPYLEHGARGANIEPRPYLMPAALLEMPIGFYRRMISNWERTAPR